MTEKGYGAGVILVQPGDTLIICFNDSVWLDGGTDLLKRFKEEGGIPDSIKVLFVDGVQAVTVVRP